MDLSRYVQGESQVIQRRGLHKKGEILYYYTMVARIYINFLLINFHEPTVREPTHGVSYLNHSNPLFHEPTVKGPTHGVNYFNQSNPLFHVLLTLSLTSFALGVNFPETLGSVWFKSYLNKGIRLCKQNYNFSPLYRNA